MENISDYLFTQGILGVANVVQAFIVVRFYMKTEKLQTKIDDLHEARRQDAVETRDQVTSVLPGISQSLSNIHDKIEISKRME